MPEEFGFEQRLWNGAAVERDEPMLPPWAGQVDGASDHFFPGAGVSVDQDRRGGCRDGFDQLEERTHARAAADHGREPETLIELLPQIRVFILEPPLLERRAQDVNQLVELKRLGNEIRGAAFNRLDRIFDRAVSRDHDRDDAGIELQSGIDDFAAVDPGQPQIGDDDIERELAKKFDGFFARLRLRHLKSVLDQALRRHRSKRRLIVHEKQMYRLVRHLRVRHSFDAGSATVKR